MQSISNIHTEYTEIEKVQWILEHGHPKFVWIFERADDILYRRPMAQPGTELPPWMNTDREIVRDFKVRTNTQHKEKN